MSRLLRFNQLSVTPVRYVLYNRHEFVCLFVFFKMLFLDTIVLNIYIFPTKSIYCIFF